MKKLVGRILSLVCCVFFLSCSEEQNFDQFDDVSLTPTLASGILYVETNEETINLIPAMSDVVRDEFEFDAFSEGVFADRVLEGALIYEVENTTSKQLEITLEFLGAGDIVLDTEVFQIDPEPTADLQRTVAYGSGGKSLEYLINTEKIRVTVNNQSDNTSVSTIANAILAFKLAGEFRVRVK